MTYPPMPVAVLPPPLRRGRGSAWRFWPDVPDGAGRAVFAAAFAAAVLTVLTEPYAVVGVAGLLTGIAVAAGPVAVVVAHRAARWRLVRPLPLAAGAASLALVAVGTVRDATWLYVLCLLTALGLAGYGLAGGRRWAGVLLAGALPPYGLLRGTPWLLRGMRRLGSTGAGPLRLFLVMAGTGVLLLVFGALFASADAAFGHLVASLAPDVDPASVVARGVVATVVAGFTLGAAFLARVPPRLDRITAGRPRPVRRVEWLVPLLALVGLFAGFVAVQLTVLFGGDGHVLRTAGLTYAEYAHQGFAQLVVVTLLTLAVLAAVTRWAPRRSRADRILLRAVPGALCVLTLVIVASALYRLHVYQQVYGFTRLRLLVDVFELWLGLMFVLILIAGVRLRGGWLPRAVVGTGVAALLGLAVLNPDAWIAERNVARYQETGRIDTEYLGELSADAVVVLDRLPEPRRGCALVRIATDLAGPDPWYGYNAARERARDLLARRPAGHCQPGGR